MHRPISRWPATALAVALVLCVSAAANGQGNSPMTLYGDPGYQMADFEAPNTDLYSVSNSNFSADKPKLADRVADLESRLDAADKALASAKSKASGKPSVTIGGRFFWDWANISEDANSIAQGNSAQNGAEPRATWLYVKGEAFDVVDYTVRISFENQITYKDVYFTVKELPVLSNVRVGHFKEPFSIEQLTLNKFTTFMERSLADVFVPARSLGVMAFDCLDNERFTWAVGAFKDQLPDNRPAFSDDNASTALTMRYTFLPWYDEATEGRGLFHTGIGYSFRDATSDQVRFSQRPEAHLAPTVVGTPWMNAHGYQLFNAEAAFVYGPFSVQTEYIGAFVDRVGQVDTNFNGVYFYTSYFLTGEHRSYDRPNGTFSRVKPFENFFRVRDEDGNIQMGKGAWELGYRYSYLDLNDDNIAGGRVSDHTIGLNWYLTPYTRLMWNYVRATTDVNNLTGNMDIFEMRAQMDF